MRREEEKDTMHKENKQDFKNIYNNSWQLKIEEWKETEKEAREHIYKGGKENVNKIHEKIRK